jgi:hypothetical protein
MSMSPISDRITAAARTLLQFVTSEDPNAPVRLFGSAAVALRCRKYSYLWEAASRGEIADIDLVTTSSYRAEIRRIFAKNQLVEDFASMLYDAMFQRILFAWNGTPYTVEVFFDPLDLHHKIELGEQLTSEPLTISLADLVLTKLQFEDLKDRPAQLIDLCIVLAEHEVVPSGSVGVSGGRVAALTARDWGLWNTVNQGLAVLSYFAKSKIPDNAAQINILRNIEKLKQAINSVAHSPRWKAEALAHKLLPCLRSGKPVYEPANDPWANWRK